MIGGLIQLLENVTKTLNPDAIFEFETSRMINVKIDTVTRDKMFVYIEEPTQATINMDLYQRTTQSTLLRIYFCRFEKMHNDNWPGDSQWNEKANSSIHRQSIRDSIEEQMVRPFITLIRRSSWGNRYRDAFNSLRILYPYPRFDANEVSVGIEFTIREKWCLDNYIPDIPNPPGLTDVQISLNWIDHLGNAVRNPQFITSPAGVLYELPAIDPELILEMATKDQVFEDWNLDWRGGPDSFHPGDNIGVAQNTILWARFRNIQ